MERAAYRCLTFMITMSPDAHYRTGWPSVGFMRGPLTDRKIAKYQKLGYYSAEFREARKELQARKRKRKGNFVESEDGRLVYSPL